MFSHAALFCILMPAHIHTHTGLLQPWATKGAPIRLAHSPTTTTRHPPFLMPPRLGKPLDVAQRRLLSCLPQPCQASPRLKRLLASSPRLLLTSCRLAGAMAPRLVTAFTRIHVNLDDSSLLLSTRVLPFCRKHFKCFCSTSNSE